MSEDPELREEMEKEVGSTNSAVVAAAAGWANWAVGAVTAKFYKSPTTETSGGSGSKDKSASPEASSVAESVKKVNLNTDTSKSPAAAVTQRSEGISDGWADDGDNDGWGDLNEKTEDQAEGWDDNDDWGSLEDNKSSSNQNNTVQSSGNFDFGGGGFNTGTKTHDAFAEIKPASDNLMAGPGGWDDWGASSPGGEESKDEARRRRTAGDGGTVLAGGGAAAQGMEQEPLALGMEQEPLALGMEQDRLALQMELTAIRRHAAA